MGWGMVTGTRETSARAQCMMFLQTTEEAKWKPLMSAWMACFQLPTRGPLSQWVPQRAQGLFLPNLVTAHRLPQAHLALCPWRSHRHLKTPAPDPSWPMGTSQPGCSCISALALGPSHELRGFPRYKAGLQSFPSSLSGLFHYAQDFLKIRVYWTDIHGTFHPKAAEYTFFPMCPWNILQARSHPRP